MTNICELHCRRLGSCLLIFFFFSRFFFASLLLKFLLLKSCAQTEEAFRFSCCLNWIRKCVERCRASNWRIENQEKKKLAHSPVATLFMQSRYRVPCSSYMYWPFPRTIFSGSDLKNNWHDFLNLTESFCVGWRGGLKIDKMLQNVRFWTFIDLLTHPMCRFRSSMVFCLGIISFSLTANIVLFSLFFDFTRKKKLIW